MTANLTPLAVIFPLVHWTVPKIIGALIASVSLPLLLLSRWQLGASFSVRPKAHALVTTGLYSRIRNPMYLFASLFVSGISLLFSVWGPVAVLVVLVPLQILNARKEDRILALAFGEQYECYKRSTWF